MEERTVVAPAHVPVPSNPSLVQQRVLTVLDRLTREPQAILEPSLLYSRLVSWISAETGYENCALLLLDNNGRLAKVAATGLRTAEKRRTYPLPYACLGAGKKAENVFLINDVETVPLAQKGSCLGRGAVLCTLLKAYFDSDGPDRRISNSGVIGAILLEDERVDAFTPADCEFMQSIAPYVSMAIDFARRCKQASEMAQYDELTGLYSRRFFQDYLQKELTRAKRTGHPFSVVIIDMDRLKMVNDVYGHMAGDAVLQIMGRVLAKNVRNYDVLARYGGDEFILIMPDTKASGVQRAMNRLVASSDRARLDYLSHSTLLPSYSYGFGTFPEDGKTFEDVFAVADRRLREAKTRKGIHAPDGGGGDSDPS